MFDDSFEVFLADTNESKEIHYSIRYQVYCEEMGFENKDYFPKKQEVDECDRHSKHFIIRHKQSGHWVGAMRLIFKTDQLLPIEKHCILNETIDKNDSVKSVELSRLCLIKEIRRRLNDYDPAHGVINDNNEIKETDKKKLFKNSRSNRRIIWGMIYAASKYSYDNNIPHWYFLTTRALEKVLRKGNLNMMNIGDPCYLKGERHPFKMNAYETYLSEIWNDDCKMGYHRFSELNFNKTYQAA